MSKKNPFTFTLMFSPGNPLHEKAVEIINRQGRSKSQFIAAAVIHFMDCNQIPTSSLVQDQQMETMIEKIVRRTVAELGTVPMVPSVPPTAPKHAAGPTPQTVSVPSQDDLTEVDGALLVSGLDAFRKGGNKTQL